MTIPTLPGVTARAITTARLTTRVLFTGPEDGIPVLFLHGNLSSATWWEETMIALPRGYCGIAPDQRGFGEADAGYKIDATRGMGDFVDDVLALLDVLGIERAHVVGNSMGGSIVWRIMMDCPERLLTATLVGPASPYGFGGTRDVNGLSCYADYAGSGGGLFSRKLIQLIREGDRSLQHTYSPRAALRSLVYRPPFVPAREEELLSALLAVHIGPQDTPGDVSSSINWPYFAPGIWGATNALSPKYVGDVSRLYAARPKVDILWVRGSHDIAISDSGASDPATFGSMGLIKNYPGPEVYPPQPMVTQIRSVLARYAASGGSYKEVVIEGSGHVPFIETPDEFNNVFHAHLR